MRMRSKIEEAAGLQDAAHLAEKSCFVRDVHADVDHVGAVKCCGFERELQSASVMKVRGMVQFDPPRQTRRYLDEFLGQINSRDLAASFRGKVTCRPADAASDIEKAESGTQFHPRSQLLRGLNPADVKFVDWGQIRSGKASGIFSRAGNCLKDGVFDPAA